MWTSGSGSGCDARSTELSPLRVASSADHGCHDLANNGMASPSSPLPPHEDGEALDGNDEWFLGESWCYFAVRNLARQGTGVMDGNADRQVCHMDNGAPPFVRPDGSEVAVALLG